MSPINIQVNNDICAKAVGASANTEPAIANTSKTLAALLLASNSLRQKTEKVVVSLEAVPRTKALEHALATGSQKNP